MKLLIPIFLILAMFAGCKAKVDSEAEAPHHHDPPHGGTTVMLGQDDAHLELVRDATTGKLELFILGPHMHDFIRIAQSEIVLEIEGREPLVLKPVASGATGEKAGDTSLFSVVDPWVQQNAKTNVKLKEIHIRGNTYKAVLIPFPEAK